MTHQEYTLARRNLMGGTVVYLGTANGISWLRIVALRIKGGVYQGKVLATGRWMELEEVREA